MNKNHLLAALLSKQQPGAEQLRNTARMRGAGPDTPIEWSAFSSAPQQEPVDPGILEQLFSPAVTPAYAGTEQQTVPAGGDGLLKQLAMKMFMMGWKPEQEFKPKR